MSMFPLVHQESCRIRLNRGLGFKLPMALFAWATDSCNYTKTHPELHRNSQNPRQKVEKAELNRE